MATCRQSVSGTQSPQSTTNDQPADCRCSPRLPVRIVIAHEFPFVRDGVARMLATQTGYVVVGTAASGGETLGLANDLEPDLLLVDADIREPDAFEVLRTLSTSHPRLRLVLFAEHSDKEQFLNAIQSGVHGILLKDSPPALLYKCIRCVAAGHYWFGHDRMPDLIDAFRNVTSVSPPSSPIDSLTPREIEIITAVINGATNRDISAQLTLSEQTVKNHLSHIYDKVGVSNRVELVLFALHHKLTERRG